LPRGETDEPHDRNAADAGSEEAPLRSRCPQQGIL